jgi:hypothetical protein
MSKLVGWILYVAFLVMVVIAGWDQPLKVHFTPKEAPTPAAQSQATAPNDWMHDGKRWDTVNRYLPNGGVPGKAY